MTAPPIACQWCDNLACHADVCIRHGAASLGWTPWPNPRIPSRLSISSTWAAFAALVERNNGIFGGCWCMGFHLEDSRTDAAHNRAAKEQRVREGQAHAALVFDGDDCVGWCQFGAPDEVPRIKNRAAYEKARTASPDWRITCCYVGKGHRRQGVATAALAGALDLIAGLGGGTVEGYPEDADSVPAGFLFNGALFDLREARVHL